MGAVAPATPEVAAVVHFSNAFGAAARTPPKKALVWHFLLTTLFTALTRHVQLLEECGWDLFGRGAHVDGIIRAALCVALESIPHVKLKHP